MVALSALLLAFGLSPVVWAQSTTPTVPQTADDLEYRASELAEQEKKLEVQGGFEAQWHEVDNLDLRLLDETSDQAILDSDDRNRFAFSGAFLDLGYRVNDELRLLVSFSHRGLWGNDQLGVVNAFGGFVYFTGLYMEYTPTWGSYTPTIQVGRMYTELGGLGGGQDYILADVLDMVKVNLPLGDFGRLELVPATVVGMSSSNDRANFVSFIGQSTTQTFGFRGDHMTLRGGGSLIMDRVDRLDLRAYLFYTDVGALGSGSDISYNGALGNFSDNDWVANAGVRGHVDLGAIRPYFSVDAPQAWTARSW